MIQQIALARALLGNPALVLLDEPTRSLDADARKRLWDAIERRPRTGVLIATHLEEDSTAVTAASTFPLRAPAGARSLPHRSRVREQEDVQARLRPRPSLRDREPLRLLLHLPHARRRPRTADLGDAPTYFAFALVGIAITNVIGAASTGLAYRIREEQFTGTLEAVIVQPVTLGEVSIGLAGYPFLFSMGRAALYILVGGTCSGSASRTPPGSASP